MIITTVPSRRLNPPQDDLAGLLDHIAKVLTAPPFTGPAVVAISSKVVSIAEGNCQTRESIDRDTLIQAQSDYFLPRAATPGRRAMHTIAHGRLMPSAGVDTAGEYFVMLPHDPNGSARSICTKLRHLTGRPGIGVIITDSTSMPLRRGVIGITLGYFGFVPVRDSRKETDLFGAPLATMTNLADALSAAAVLAMGEGRELTPAAVITGLPPTIEFINTPYAPTDADSSFEIPVHQDLYAPLIEHCKWLPGKKSPKH